MITPEEKESIINEAIERALLKLPEVVTSLIQTKIAQEKIKAEFFDKNKDFKLHPDVVAGIISSIEGNSPGRKYEDILNEATPKIREKIGTVGSLNNTEVKKPSDLSFGEL